MSTQDTANPSQKATLLLALSGPSSSGKTTLARILHRSIFPVGSTILLHLDDFYLPEAELPYRDGLVDWDSAASLDLTGLEKTLEHIQQHGVFPPGFVSKEDTNAVGDVPISETTVVQLADELRGWWNAKRIADRVKQVVIVDGFLLVGKSIPQIRGLFDVRVLLRAAFADAKRRREARQGYATIEGWWEDPPGYVERVVWPAFVEEHAFLFEGGDVEGDVDQKVVGELGIDVVPKGASLEEALKWVVEILTSRIETRIE